jgi:hypothetical protein
MAFTRGTRQSNGELHIERQSLATVEFMLFVPALIFRPVFFVKSYFYLFFYLFLRKTRFTATVFHQAIAMTVL